MAAARASNRSRASSTRFPGASDHDPSALSGGAIVAPSGVSAYSTRGGTSAWTLRAALPGRPAVVVTDSFGRAWRQGQCEVAIGCAGLAPARDWRGERDAGGRELHATVIAIADEVAAAADLVRGKTSREPAVRIRGLERYVTAEDGPGTTALVRRPEDDLFR